MRPTRPAAPLLLALLALPALPVSAAGGAEPDQALSADQIYEKVLENRFEASAQELVIDSGDRVGREQHTVVQMLWRRYGEGSSEAKEGIQSRTLVRYLEPGDVRGAGYLVINKSDLPNDQFMYLKSLRRVRRINLRTETVIGTDLSIEDIVPREMDEATYVRLDDGEIDGRPCYTIEATPTQQTDSQYSKLLLAIETEHFVPLETRYFDGAGVEIKVLRAEPDSIREIEGIWLPLRARMDHRLDLTYTRIRVDRLAPNPELPKKLFTERQLTARKLRLPKEIDSASLRF